MTRQTTARRGTRGESEQGFALIAAMGIFVALLTLVTALSSFVQYNVIDAKRFHASHAQLAVAEAGAWRALLEGAAGAEGAVQRRYEFDGEPCVARLQPMKGGEDLYARDGLVFHPGDVRIETEAGTPLRAMRSVWLANSSPGAKRMILLEHRGREGA